MGTGDATLEALAQAAGDIRLWNLDPRWHNRVALTDMGIVRERYQQAMSSGRSMDRPQNLVLNRGTPFEGVRGAYRRNDVAVMRISGPTFYRADDEINQELAWWFQGTITEQFARELDVVSRDPKLRGVVIEFDTPGGEAAGNPEVSQQIHDLAQRLPVVAHSGNLCCSAGFYLASGASELVGSRSSEWGSIGSVQIGMNATGMLKKIGLEQVILRSQVSPHKYPTIDNAKGVNQYQRHVNRSGKMFVADVARMTGVSEDTILTQWGGGDWLGAEDALAVGMIDSIGMFDATVEALAGTSTSVPVVYEPPGDSKANLDLERTEDTMADTREKEKETKDQAAERDRSEGSGSAGNAAVMAELAEVRKDLAESNRRLEERDKALEKEREARENDRLERAKADRQAKRDKFADDLAAKSQAFGENAAKLADSYHAAMEIDAEHGTDLASGLHAALSALPTCELTEEQTTVEPLEDDDGSDSDERASDLPGRRLANRTADEPKGGPKSEAEFKKSLRMDPEAASVLDDPEEYKRVIKSARERGLVK